jgi:hypothetical protein
MLLPLFYVLLFVTTGMMAVSLYYAAQFRQVPRVDPIPAPLNFSQPEQDETIRIHDEAERWYLGVHHGHIAIFRGDPPDGSLEEVTEFEVKDDIRDQLEQGVPFYTIEELQQLLESYTS